MYRTPGSDIASLRKLSEFVLQQFNSDTGLIITVNFNLTGLDWQTLSITNAEHKRDLLFDLGFRLNLSQIVPSPTRITACTSSTIHLAFVNKKRLAYPCDCESVAGVFDNEII